MKVLYILGNGFDMHHGLNTSYSDFKKFVSESNRPLYRIIEKFLYFEVKNEDSIVWNEFEYNLRNLDEDQIFDECNCFIKGYGDDDWRDSFHHDYQQCIEEITEGLTRNLLKEFTTWIKIRNNELAGKKQKVNLNHEAIYLTFNYTMTLETVYGIDPKKILHIHNSTDDDCELILGHNYSDEERVMNLNKTPVIKFMSDIDELLAERGLEEDIRYREGKSIIQSYYNKNYKNCHEIIRKNRTHFAALTDIDDIYVLGHSVSDVDTVYFDEIISNIVRIPRWYFTYHTEKDLSNINRFTSSRGIEEYCLLNLSDDLFTIPE